MLEKKFSWIKESLKEQRYLLEKFCFPYEWQS